MFNRSLVRELMIKNGMTRDALAAYLFVSLDSVNQWFSHRDPQPIYVKTMADLFDVPYEKIGGKSGNKARRDARREFDEANERATESSVSRGGRRDHMERRGETRKRDRR